MISICFGNHGIQTMEHQSHPVELRQPPVAAKVAVTKLEAAISSLSIQNTLNHIFVRIKKIKLVCPNTISSTPKPSHHGNLGGFCGLMWVTLADELHDMRLLSPTSLT